MASKQLSSSALTRLAKSTAILKAKMRMTVICGHFRIPETERFGLFSEYPWHILNDLVILPPQVAGVRKCIMDRGVIHEGE